MTKKKQRDNLKKAQAAAHTPQARAKAAATRARNLELKANGGNGAAEPGKGQDISLELLNATAPEHKKLGKKAATVDALKSVTRERDLLRELVKVLYTRGA